MRDEYNDGVAVIAIPPATYTDDNPVISVDRSGYDSVTFGLLFGAGGITFTPSNRIDFIMEHSDDGVTWDPVGASNVLGAVPDASGIVLSQRSAHAAATVHRFGYIDGIVGDRRYVRLRADFAGTHGTGTSLAAFAMLEEASSQPVGVATA